MPCSVELNDTTKIPVIGGFPSDNEYFLVVGASQGAGQGGYGLRAWANLRSCILSKLSFPEFNTIIGVDGVLSNGVISYIIGEETGTPVTNIISQSVKVTIDSLRVYPIAVTNQIYSTIVYNLDNTVTVNFFNYSLDNPATNLGLLHGMKLIIDYAIIN